jgi:hypothetical protein
MVSTGPCASGGGVCASASLFRIARRAIPAKTLRRMEQLRVRGTITQPITQLTIFCDGVTVLIVVPFPA